MQTTFLAATATIMIAAALTLSGWLLYELPTVIITFALPPWWLAWADRGPVQQPTFPFDKPTLLGYFAACGFLGVIVALPLTRLRSKPFVTRLVLAVWVAVAINVSVRLRCQMFQEYPPPWQDLLIAGGMVALLPLGSILFTCWLGSRKHNMMSSYHLFAFFFIGCSIGGASRSLLGFERFGEFHGIFHQAEIAPVLLGCAGLLFIFALGCLVLLDARDDPVNSPPPSMSCRLRWALLGGLPACAILGLLSFLDRNIGDIPRSWLIPLTLYPITWVVALARIDGEKPNLSCVILQVLTAVPIALLFDRDSATEAVRFAWWDFAGREPSWLMTAFFASVVVLAYLPHGFTLSMQGSSLALALLQIQLGLFMEFRMRETGAVQILSILLIHMGALVLICWGCHGDAVKDAPAPDRLPEFLFFALGGFVVCGIAYQVLAPRLFPQWGIAYPLALIAGLAVRLLTRRLKGACRTDR